MPLRSLHRRDDLEGCDALVPGLLGNDLYFGPFGGGIPRGLSGVRRRSPIWICCSLCRERPKETCLNANFVPFSSTLPCTFQTVYFLFFYFLNIQMALKFFGMCTWNVNYESWKDSQQEHKLRLLFLVFSAQVFEFKMYRVLCVSVPGANFPA